jgi:hypothetical protein
MKPARSRAVLGALALALTISFTVSCTTPGGGSAPAGDAFYKPPAPLPAGSPGDVIWWRNSGYAGVADVKAFQVLYHSHTALDAPDAVSGTVLVPAAPWTGAGPRPIIAYGAFTLGLGDQCAASKTAYNNGNDPAVNALLQRGWAVAVSDYEGLGTPGVHTYMVGQSQGRAVLDSVRAAVRLPGSGLSAQAPVGIAGYSQGGASAGWAGELAPAYAPELRVKGIVAGGTPSDLQRVAQNLEGGFWYGLAAMAAPGFDAAYPELDLGKYLNDQGRTLLTAGGLDKCVAGILVQGAYKRTTQLTTTNPLTDPAWQARLAENKLGSRTPAAPVLMYHSSDDEVIPVDQARTAAAAWCARGVPVQFQTGTGGHVGGVTAVIDPGTNYLADRLAGKPAPSTC